MYQIGSPRTKNKALKVSQLAFKDHGWTFSTLKLHLLFSPADPFSLSLSSSFFKAAFFSSLIYGL